MAVIRRIVMPVVRPIVRALTEAYGALFTPAALFGNNEQGVWYDPSDLTTLFQDSAGTTPVTAVEQPVGLVLDKRKGLVLGPELVTNGTFNTNINGWTAQFTSTASWQAGALRSVSSGTNAGEVSSPITCVVGRTYKVTGTVVGGTSTGRITASSSAFGGTGGAYVSSGAQVFYFTATATTMYVVCGNGSGTNGFYCDFDNISVRELPGNHAYQSASASRPVLSARVNLLTKTEQFDNAAWTKLNTTVTANSITAPDGTLTADALIETTATGIHRTGQSFTPSVIGSFTSSVIGKAGSRSWLAIQNDFGSNNTTQLFNLTTGVLGSQAGLGGTATITSLGNGWYRCTLTTVTSTLNAGACNIYVSSANNTNSYTGDGTSGIYIWGADLRVANIGVGLPSYQRVNTASDYTATGFPYGEAFDGVDDSLIANAGGGSTSAFFWCSSIQVGKVGAVQTLFSDTGTNTGYRVRINASNQLEFSAGNGTAYTTVATTATLSLGQRAVLTVWHDGANLNAQIDNGTVHQQAFATATAGTAQFTLGKDNNAASSFFTGRLFENVYIKDVAPSASQISNTKKYVADIAKITLT